jgi:nucleotidyltransferase substrate binding protein (TIGR01987 family)
MEQAEIRWQQRFSNYRKALARLTEVTHAPSELSELEKDGMIHRFEYVYDLGWKTLQDLLQYNGYTEVKGPNPTLTQALADGYITDEVGWRKMKKSRELTSHTYDDDSAEIIATDIVRIFCPLLVTLEQKLTEEQNGKQSNLFA